MNKIFKIIRSLEIAVKSNSKLLSFFRKGASISSTMILHNIKAIVSDFGTIIDVGANMGQFSITAKSFFPSSNVYCFEPVPKTFDILNDRVKNIDGITAYNFALGNAEGMINFYSNEYSHASSALPLSDLQKTLMPQTANQEEIKVPVHKLDNIIGQISLKSPVLLKLDVQGFEKEVLLGALKNLNQIDFLLFESSFVPLYEGEPLFDEMHIFVKELGFELIGPMGILQSDNMQILQMDMLYRRSVNRHE